MTREELLARLAPVLETLRTLDAAQPSKAEAALAVLDTSAIGTAVAEAWREGWLTPREGGGVRFGRLSKALPEVHGFSIDAVEMDGPASGPHTHPKGEFDLCFPVDAGAHFDGRADRWIVYPPASRHVPTVTGGRMLILYFLPDGAIDFSA